MFCLGTCFGVSFKGNQAETAPFGGAPKYGTQLLQRGQAIGVGLKPSASACSFSCTREIGSVEVGQLSLQVHRKRRNAPKLAVSLLARTRAMLQPDLAIGLIVADWPPFCTQVGVFVCITKPFVHNGRFPSPCVVPQNSFVTRFARRKNGHLRRLLSPSKGAWACLTGYWGPLPRRKKTKRKHGFRWLQSDGGGELCQGILFGS